MGHSPTYDEDMLSAKFCLAPAGQGWGKRNVQAAIMGCVPVVISDGVYQPFEPFLDWSEFGLKVAEADILQLPAILAAVSDEQYKRKQVGGAGLLAGCVGRCLATCGVDMVCGCACVAWWLLLVEK